MWARVTPNTATFDAVNMLEGNFKDRGITDDLAGKKVKALYGNGWFIRNI